MRNFSVFLVLVMILTLTSSANAIDQTGRFSIGGYLGYAFGFGDAFEDQEVGYYHPQRGFVSWSYENDLSFCLGAKIKYGLNSNWALEGGLDYQSGDVDVKVATGVVAYGVDRSYDWTAILSNMVYTLSPDKKTTPNLTGGLGIYMDGGTELGINLGGGIEHFFQDNLSLDAGARFHMIFKGGSDITYLQIRAGVLYYLGTR
jgi:hypothetical protein